MAYVYPVIGRRPQPRDEGEPDPRAAAAAERERLRQHIEREAGFRVTTVDRLNWICPYTLVLVPAPFDVVTTACGSLLARKPWASGKPRPIADILAVRWSQFLLERWELEPRLHLHAPDGRWLNPWTGTWVPIPGNQARGEVIAQRARHLALLPQAQLGGLLDPHQLEALLRREAAAPATGAPPAETPSTGTWRRPPPVGTGAPTTPSGRFPAAAAPPAVGATPAATTPSGSFPTAGAPPATGAIDRAALGDPARARAVLDRMLPPLPDLPGYRMAVQFEPVQGIGGDFYDLLPLGDGRWLIVIGDVSGHGAEAALIVTSAVKALRLLAPATPDLVELLVKLNDTMRPDLPAGTFITLWAAILDPAARTLVHACAGHHPALLLSLRRTETLQQVGQSGPVLGMIAGSQLRTRLRVGRLELQPGDLLAQFTDGLFEVNNPKGTEFGRLRVMGSCVANLEHAPDALASRLVKEVKRFTGGTLDDDLTLLVLGVDP